MLIETIITLFALGFAAIAVYGHVLLAQALIARKTPADATTCQPRLEAGPAPQAQLRPAS